MRTGSATYSNPSPRCCRIHWLRRSMFQNLVLGDRGGMEVAVEKLRPWFAAWLHRHRSHLQSTEPASERTSCPAFRLQPVSFRNDLLFALWYSSLVADVVSKEKRSQVMAAIRSKGNKATELKLVSILRATGITGWLRHRPLPGHLRRRLLLARLSVALPHASGQPGILVAEDHRQCCPRS
jgi:DNA mismatch endonuclease Vsr